MKTVCLHDKGEIEAFLRRDPFLHLYSLGDLDEWFWPGTTWYGRIEDGQVEAIALVYSGLAQPTLLALGEAGSPPLDELVRSIVHLLPRRFYAHLTPGVSAILAEQYRLETHGLHYKMALTDPSRLAVDRSADVVSLRAGDVSEVLAFYAGSYPGNWFEPQMLETGAYVGERIEGELIAVAGVHVCSTTYRVASLGNIATSPSHRGRGHAKAVTAALCRRLVAGVDHVGLNVKADNAAAIACYRALGFEVHAAYEEVAVHTDCRPTSRES
jgi:ribosomal protein S18 acetylase RimI-like enzyme